MPAKSAKQYGLMAAAMHGGVSGISPSVAKEFVEKTPSKKRRAFSHALIKKKKGKKEEKYDR